MSKFFKWLKSNVPLRYWAWIHAFLALGIGWGTAISLYQPASYDGVVNISLVLRMGVLTALGSIVTVIGMLMTRAFSRNTQHKGLWIELIGSVLLVGGPLQFFAIQLGFLIQEGDPDQRAAIVWFAYAMIAFMLVRFSIIIPGLIVAGRAAKAGRRRIN